MPPFFLPSNKVAAVFFIVSKVFFLVPSVSSFSLIAPSFFSLDCLSSAIALAIVAPVLVIVFFVLSPIKPFKIFSMVTFSPKTLDKPC